MNNQFLTHPENMPTQAFHPLQVAVRELYWALKAQQTQETLKVKGSATIRDEQIMEAVR
jgi:hypothetical protein